MNWIFYVRSDCDWLGRGWLSLVDYHSKSECCRNNFSNKCFITWQVLNAVWFYEFLTYKEKCLKIIGLWTDHLCSFEESFWSSTNGFEWKLFCASCENFLFCGFCVFLNYFHLGLFVSVSSSMFCTCYWYFIQNFLCRQNIICFDGLYVNEKCDISEIKILNWKVKKISAYT